MAKATPAFQFYPSAFLVGTQGMTAAAKGCYICMLASSWATGPIADTPLAIAAAMCLTPFDPPYADMWREIQPKWTLGPSGWFNKRLEEVRAEQEAYRQSQSDKGRKSAEVRAAKVNHGSTGVATTVQPVLQPEGQPKVNPLVFDLCTSSLSLPSSAPTSLPSQEPRAQDRPMITRPIRSQGLGGVHPSCDSSAWGACAKGLCVHPKLIDRWRKQLDGQDADAYIRQFVDSVCDGISGPVGDTPWTFWEKQWGNRHGVLQRPDDRPKSGVDGNRDAARRLLAKIEREEREALNAAQR